MRAGAWKVSGWKTWPLSYKLFAFDKKNSDIFFNRPSVLFINLANAVQQTAFLFGVYTFKNVIKSKLVQQKFTFSPNTSWVRRGIGG